MKSVWGILLLLSACSLRPQAAGFTHLSYTVVGGKPAAAHERLQLDCTNRTASLRRWQPFNNDEENHQAELTAQQCQTIQQYAENICINDSQGETDIADGATYTLECSNDQHQHSQWRWLESNQSRPQPYLQWHRYSRELIDQLFGQVPRYN